jgi:hypothetical protein
VNKNQGKYYDCGHDPSLSLPLWERNVHHLGHHCGLGLFLPLLLDQFAYH